jgi:hypothetical protein
MPMKSKEFDTIIVPAKEEGFQAEFLTNRNWFSVRLSKASIEQLKYIAPYRVAPISSITHYAKIGSIKPFKNTDRYIIYLEGEPIEITPVRLDSPYAPQSVKFSRLAKLLSAKWISQL